MVPLSSKSPIGDLESRIGDLKSLIGGPESRIDDIESLISDTEGSSRGGRGQVSLGVYCSGGRQGAAEGRERDVADGGRNEERGERVRKVYWREVSCAVPERGVTRELASGVAGRMLIWVGLSRKPRS